MIKISTKYIVYNELFPEETIAFTYTSVCFNCPILSCTPGWQLSLPVNIFVKSLVTTIFFERNTYMQ